MYLAGMPTTARRLDHTILRLKAISDVRRLRILLLLAGGERCVCELQDALDAGQSLLSFHLRTLKDAGLVHDRREGRWAYYSLNRKGVEELEAFLRDLRTREESVHPACRE
jgi:ArsR family transcriptional regulator, arsenate/arsenite/antimonite-responsive transcriptional repressor